MTSHGDVDASRVLLSLAALTLLVSLSLFGVGIASLVSDILGGGTAAGTMAFAFASILLGIAWSLHWLRGHLAAQAARRQPR